MKPLDQQDELKAYYADRRVADEYLRRRTAEPLNGFLHRRQVGFLNRVVRELRPRRLLEIAPGPARLGAELDFDGEAVAIDYSPAMLATARSRLGSRERSWLVLRGDAFQLPFADGSFDFVYSLKFVRHFQLHDRQRLYAEVRRVLRPGGAFVLDAQNRAISLPHRRQKGLEKYPIYDVLYDRAELLAELAAEGFRVLRVEGILHHFPQQQRLNRLRRFGLGALARVLIVLLDRLPGRSPSTWMVLNQVGG
jgi:ubiquinone/menaquinone biosynthesis C-methylase UbiE